MRVTWSRMSHILRRTFRTAKAIRTRKEALLVKIAHDGVTGWGEAAPTETYQQDVDSCEAALLRAAPLLGDDPWLVEDISARLLNELGGQCAAVAAIDAAIHDWMGRRLNVPVFRLLGLDPRRIPLTSFTIGIAEPAEIEQSVQDAAEYPILKVKLGSAQDLPTLTLIRRLAPQKRLRVDANAAWTAPQALELLPMLADLGVEFVEQPLPAGDLDGLKRLTDARICPIFADESCVHPADVLPLRGRVDGINIKLCKCGGIRPALTMIRLARASGLKILLGCMIESSLGIAATAHLAPLADELDLDGHLLISNDPFRGVDGRGGRFALPEGPGLGVEPEIPNSSPADKPA